MTFGSLFAGIGGFDLGFERAGMQCRWQVEIDEYANRVLAKHWPNVSRWNDITTFPPAYGDWSVDVICGGFPCQDISYAGKGAGLQGERSGLFYEAIRVIREVGPSIVVLENVAALLTRGMDQVLGTLASIGFDAEWHCIPAAVFGSHHIRQRVFVIASRPNSCCIRWQRWWDVKRKIAPWSHQQFERLLQAETQLSIPAGSRGGISDGVPNRLHRLRGLGNAVVPQVAEYIGRQIMEAAK